MEVNSGDIYIVLNVSDLAGNVMALYTLNGTHYGRILPIFRSGQGELEQFREYAAASLKPGYKIETTAMLANNLDQVHDTLEQQNLLPAGESRVAVEGTAFFDEVIAQLITDTLWQDEPSE